jgi:hypothetical protein
MFGLILVLFVVVGTRQGANVITVPETSLNLNSNVDANASGSTQMEKPANMNVSFSQVIITSEMDSQPANTIIFSQESDGNPLTLETMTPMANKLIASPDNTTVIFQNQSRQSVQIITSSQSKS